MEPILREHGGRQSNNLDIKTLTRVNKLIIEYDNVYNKNKTRAIGVSV